MEPGAAELYDQALLGILQHVGNVQDFLRVLFGFLYRKTDFYRLLRHPSDRMGFPPGAAQALVLQVTRAGRAGGRAAAAGTPGVPDLRETRPAGTPDPHEPAPFPALASISPSGASPDPPPGAAASSKQRRRLHIKLLLGVKWYTSAMGRLRSRSAGSRTTGWRWETVVTDGCGPLV